jgi:single-strand DNA-binding protein
MASLNKVMLMGNLTRDAELKHIGESSVLEFRLAVNRKWKDASGQEKDEVCFVDVALWGKRAPAIHEYLTKGKPLYVEGRLKLEEWDDRETGDKRQKLRVVAENVEFIGPRSDKGDAKSESEAPAASEPQASETDKKKPRAARATR